MRIPILSSRSITTVTLLFYISINVIQGFQIPSLLKKKYHVVTQKESFRISSLPSSSTTSPFFPIMQRKVSHRQNMNHMGMDIDLDIDLEINPTLPKLFPTLETSLQKLGFSTPTPIQIASAERALNAENILLIAPTGSGKTLVRKYSSM